MFVLSMTAVQMAVLHLWLLQDNLTEGLPESTNLAIQVILFVRVTNQQF